jgi:hypothetical protein
MSKDTHTFSAVQENIRAHEVKSGNDRWMSRRPQLCWKCQKEKQIKGGSLKFFGSVRRFICVDCVLTKQTAIAREKGEIK